MRSTLVDTRGRRRDAGFTLIELLVVIVILGVLASVVVFAVGGITNRGESSAEKADRVTIMHAEESYLAQATGAAKYATESELVPGYMDSTSTYHDVCLNHPHKKYAIVNVGESCPSGMSLAP